MTETYTAQDAVIDLDRERRARSTQAMGDVEESPQNAGRALELEEATGTPSPVIYHNIDDFEVQHKKSLTNQLIKGNKYLQSYIDSHPLATKVSANDWHNLDEWSEKLKALPKGRPAAFKPLDPAGGVPAGEWWESTSGIAAHWFENWWESGKEVVQSATDMFKDVGEYQYPIKDLETITQDMYKNGINAHNLASYLGALTQGVILGPVTKKDAKGEPVVRKEVAGAVNTAFGAIGAIFGITPTIRTTSQVLEEVSNVPAEFTEQAAYFGMLFLGLKGVGKSHSRGGEIPPPGIDKEVDAIREHRSKEDLKAVDETTSIAQKSETTQIAPSLAEKFVLQHVKGQSVRINVDAIRRLYGDKLPTPDDGILGWVPDLAKQIESQALVGGDVRIPMELWQTRIDPEIAKVLKDDRKVTDDGISVNEAKELKENQEALKPPPDTLLSGADISRRGFLKGIGATAASVTAEKARLVEHFKTKGLSQEEALRLAEEEMARKLGPDEGAPEPSEMTKKMVSEGVPLEEAKDLSSLPWPEEYMKGDYPKGITERGPREALRKHDEALASVRQGARLSHLVDTEPIKLDLVSKSKDMSISGDGEVVHSFDVSRRGEKIGGFQAIPRESGKLIYIDWAGAAKTHAPWQEGHQALPDLFQVGRELRKVFPDAERIGGLRGDKYVEYLLDDLAPATLAMGERPKGWEYVEGQKHPSAIKIDKAQNVPAISVSTPEGIKKYSAKSVGSVTVRAAFNQIDFAKGIRGPLGAAIRGIAQALEERVGHVPVHFLKDAEFEHIVKQHPYAQQKGTTFGLGAFYDPSAHQIIFPESQLRSPFFERNLIHEVVHAATSRGLTFDDVQTAKIQKLLDHVKSATGKKWYGLTNVHEFLAEVVSNPAFQRELRNIAIPPELLKEIGPVRGFLRSAWDVAINYIADGLGRPTDQHTVTALEAAIRLTQESVDRPFSFQEKMQLGTWRQALDTAPTLAKLPETRPSINTTGQLEMVRSLVRLEDQLMKQAGKNVSKITVRGILSDVAAGLEKDMGADAKEILARLDKDDVKNYNEYINNTDPYFIDAMYRHADFSKAEVADQLEDNYLNRIWKVIDDIKQGGAERFIKSPPTAPLADTSKEPKLPGMTRMEGRKAFKTPAASGMTRDFYEKYQKLIAQQRTEDGKRRMELILKKAQETQTAEWRQNFDRIYKEVEDSVRQNPDFLADAALRRGSLVEPEENVPKTGRKRDRLNSDMLTDEQKQVLDPSEHASGAMNPDDFAAALGFNSADGMLERLSALRQFLKDNNLKPDQLIKNIALEETERRMQAEYGDLGGKILEEARDAAMSESQYDLLHEETLSLATSANLEFSLTRQQVKGMVKKAFDDIPIGHVSEANSLRLAGKHGLAVEKALLDHDYVQAFRSKQAQYFAMEMARQAKAVEKAKATWDRNAKRFAKYKVSGVDHRYTNAIHDILMRLGETVRLTPETLADTYKLHGYTSATPFNDFIAHMMSQARIFKIPDFLFDPTFRKPFDELTVEEFRGVHDAVRSLITNGRNESKVFHEGNAEDLSNILEKKREEISVLKEKNYPIDMSKESIPAILSDLAKKAYWHGIATESMLNRLDFGNPKGLFHKYIISSYAPAGRTREGLLSEYGKKLSKTTKIENIRKKVENNLFIDPLSERPYRMDRSNVLGVLQHMGNPDNIKVLEKGHDVKSEEVLNWLKRNTTKEDWDRAQEIGDIFNELMDKVQKMEVNETGVPSERVELTPFIDPFGIVRKGWYAPLKYDPLRPQSSEKLRGSQIIEQQGYFSPSTPQGYLRQRTGYAGPLDLDLRFTPVRMHQMIHDIAMRPAVIQVSKFFMNKEFESMIRRYYGSNQLVEMKQFLADMANSANHHSFYDSQWTRAGNYLVDNMVATLVATNLFSTVPKHGITAAFNSMNQVGYKPVLKELATILRQDDATAERKLTMAWNKSEELQRRWTNWTNIVNPSAAEMGVPGMTSKFMNVRRIAMSVGSLPIAAFDMLFSAPTWLAEYNKALREPGMTEGEAIYRAERALVMTHGSTIFTNKPGILRHRNPMINSVARIYNFFNHMSQKHYEFSWKLNDRYRLGYDNDLQIPVAKISTLTGMAFTYFVLTGLIEEGISPSSKPDKKENPLMRVFDGVVYGTSSAYVGARDFVHAALWDFRDPSPGIFGTIGKTVMDIPRDVKNMMEKGWTKDRAGKFIHDMFSFTGLLTGLTTKSEGAAAEYIWRYNHGLEKPIGPWNTLAGIRYGKTKGHSRTFEEYRKKSLGLPL
jgi:hypothetical protein